MTVFSQGQHSFYIMIRMLIGEHCPKAQMTFSPSPLSLPNVAKPRTRSPIGLGEDLSAGALLRARPADNVRACFRAARGIASTANVYAGKGLAVRPDIRV